jgi:hypothetical protein
LEFGNVVVRRIDGLKNMIRYAHCDVKEQDLEELDF